VLLEMAAGIWTNSTRPPQLGQTSQKTMRLLPSRGSNNRLRRARAGTRSHARAETARSASAVRSTAGLAPSSSRAHRHAGHRAAAASGHAGCGLSSGGARSVADAAEQEQPFVVVSAASFVQAECRFLALASDAHDSTASAGSRAAGEWRRRRRRISRRRRAEASRRGPRTAASDPWRLLRRTSLSGNSARGQDHIPLPILRHGVLVFLSNEAALHEYIETGRIVAAAHLPHIEIDPARNLLAAEDQLGFLFTLCLGSPHGHRDGHHDHHDADADQQRRHRVSALTALTR